MNHNSGIINDININKSTTKKSNSMKSSSSRTRKPTTNSSGGASGGGSGSGAASDGSTTAGNSNVHAGGANSAGSSYSTGGGGGGRESGNNFDDGNDSEKEKHKLYAGISSKFIKCAWEQHDRGDLEVAPDVFSKLSEDVTYKLWELANSIKSYSRHCGGYVSTDLVNTVFKDSNVPPILGANDSPWDRIEYDRTYYFPSDGIVDLSHEFTKEIAPEECEDLRLETTWISTLDCGDHLQTFAEKLCNGIFNGLNECFQYGLELTENDPNIACIVHILLNECCSQLQKDYSSETLERCLKFLNAITYNPYTRDANVEGNLVVLAQMLVCVMLGPNKQNAEKIESRKSFKREYRVNQIIKTNDYDSDTSGDSTLSDPPFLQDNGDSFLVDCKENLKMEEDQKHEIKKLEDEIINDSIIINTPDIYTNGGGDMSTTTIIEETNLGSIGNADETRPMNDIEAQEIANFKSECEELFAIMEELRNTNQASTDDGSGGGSNIATFDSLSVKKENEVFHTDGQILTTTGNMEVDVTNIKKELLEGPPGIIKLDIDSPGKPLKVQKPRNITAFERKYSRIYTKACKRKMITNVSTTIGLITAQWGYFEKIVTLILKNRLEEYFFEKSIWTKRQFDWIVRMVHASWAVGEEASRNFLYFVDRMEASIFPEWTECHMVLAATFLRGRRDGIYYQWLYDICGDTLFPNMIYFPHALAQLQEKHARVKQLGTYHIKPKLVLKTIHKRTTAKIVDPYLVFPNANRSYERKKIHFKFPGCRPFNSQKLRKVVKLEKVEAKFAQLHRFKTAIVIGKRKIMKTLSNEKPSVQFVHFANYVL